MRKLRNTLGDERNRTERMVKMTDDQIDRSLSVMDDMEMLRNNKAYFEAGNGDLGDLDRARAISNIQHSIDIKFEELKSILDE